jgi:organic radical activating enzyme
MPVIIELLFTNSCNRNCAYCVARSKDKTYRGEQQKNNEQGDYKLESGIMNIVQLKKWLLAQKKRFGDMQIVISGGEPTLLRHYTEFLDWCFDREFKKPILYTNGTNLKDLTNCQHNPKDLVKVLLTHHLDSREDFTRECVNFLKELEVDFIVKLLTRGKEMREFGDSLECRYVVEGIRELYSENPEEKARQLTEYMPLSGDSPYRWRWNGYGDLIDRDRTAWKKTVVLTVDPPGLVWNCHLFESPVGNIYEPEKEMSNLQIAWCPYWDTYNQETMECKETRCEIQHYVNLMEELA